MLLSDVGSNAVAHMAGPQGAHSCDMSFGYRRFIRLWYESSCSVRSGVGVAATPKTRDHGMMFDGKKGSILM